MMANFLKKNLTTLILAASFGLNVTLAIILISQSASRDRSAWHVPGPGMGMRGEDFRRPDWGTRMSAMPDSLRSFPRFEQEQLESLRELRRAMFTEIEPIREEINTLQGLIQEELKGPEPTITHLDSMTARIMRLQNRIQQRTLRLILREREILTPEQYQVVIRFMVPGYMGQMFDSSGRGYSDRERGDSDRGRGRGRGGPDPYDGKPPPPPPYF